MQFEISICIVEMSPGPFPGADMQFEILVLDLPPLDKSL
jgi:hypothetical protein